MDTWKRYIEALETMRKVRGDYRRSPYSRQAKRRILLQRANLDRYTDGRAL